jgi:oligopeptidase A
LAHKLYGITFQQKHKFSSWHKDVRLYEIKSGKNNLIGRLYLDLYARANKQNGAWMHDCKARRKLTNGSIQTPAAYIVGNFSPAPKEDEALLTHDEVVTLFHEFGHALQHLLTKVDYADISGINGVPWDAVELPSQFMENWCFETPILHAMSRHYKTGKHLSNELISSLRKSKNFQAGLHMLRQLEFALFDFNLHLANNFKSSAYIQKTLNATRKKTSIIPASTFNRFQNSFLHIFAGGYAAGYYSYKWAEVLAADAYEKFRTTGLFNRKTAQSFLHNILERGGAEEPMVLFQKFRGRKPKITALLKQCGIKK